MEHVVMVIPKDADVAKAKRVSQKYRETGREREKIGAGGHLQLQHHDSNDDGDHSIRESFQTLLIHRRT